MVAYSFNSRFAEPIIAGTKRQTIRAQRKRHARPGEALQLYTGMRTKHCRKLLNTDPICSSVTPVHLIFSQWSGAVQFTIDGTRLMPTAMHIFAVEDGFGSLDDMISFWFEQHGRGAPEILFDGVLIRWNLEERA